MDANLIVSIAGFAGILATRFFDIYDRRQKAQELRDQTLLEALALRQHTTEQTGTVIAAVDRGIAQSADALEHANNLTQKVVDMREDLVSAVKATNIALDRKESKR